jgi:hypothetical protein
VPICSAIQTVAATSSVNTAAFTAAAVFANSEYSMIFQQDRGRFPYGFNHDLPMASSPIKANRHGNGATELITHGGQYARNFFAHGCRQSHSVNGYVPHRPRQTMLVDVQMAVHIGGFNPPRSCHPVGHDHMFRAHLS